MAHPVTHTKAVRRRLLKLASKTEALLEKLDEQLLTVGAKMSGEHLRSRAVQAHILMKALDKAERTKRKKPVSKPQF